ncbi:hypothetical protein ABKN59_007690 [Abortiporus biennis]
MITYAAILLALLQAPLVFAAQAPQFAPPGPGPLIASSHYVGQSNGSLSKSQVVGGKVFDRFTQIWIENTDFDVANTSATFQKLASQGVLLSSYYAVTHPSEPNYVASIGGDFFGMGDDELYNIPANISTVVDLLEAKNISWASYQENLPTDGYLGFNFTQPDYLNTSAPPYTYYVRKHNPHAIFDSIVNVASRRSKIRNFNDFAADMNASALPQWNFFTPNLVNDAHDTDIDFASAWLEFFLVPLLSDSRFNDNRTLILLTFDENETHEINNRIYSLLLGGAVPTNLHEANWGLGSLGRGDTNKTMSNVFSFVANVTGFKNQNVTGSSIPLTNASGTTPGPLNPQMFIPFTAPNVNATGAGGGSVFIAPGLNISMTADKLPGPVNLTALGEQVPASGYANGTGPSGSVPPAPTAGGSGTSGACQYTSSVFVSISAVVVALIISFSF